MFVKVVCSRRLAIIVLQLVTALKGIPRLVKGPDQRVRDIASRDMLLCCYSLQIQNINLAALAGLPPKMLKCVHLSQKVAVSLGVADWCYKGAIAADTLCEEEFLQTVWLGCNPDLGRTASANYKALVTDITGKRQPG